MTVVRLTRFRIEPEHVEQMLAARRELVAAVRAAHGGLDEATLARVDDHAWVDIWTWRSREDLEAAAAEHLPEAAAAFANVTDARVEVAELVSDSDPDADRVSMEERFLLLGPGEVRPGRRPLPPTFAVKAATADTEGRFSLLEVALAMDIPRHVHHTADEAIYVLDGVLDVEYADTRRSAGAGSFVLLPHGVPHALRRGSTPPPRVIQISSPGGWESYLADLFDAGPAVLTAGRLDPAKINGIAGKYHIEYSESAS